MNKIVKIYISGVTFELSPFITCKIVYEITPKQIPSEIEYINPIAKIVMKAEIALSKFFVQSIFVTCCIIKNPTIIKAGAVANAGIAKKIGEKNNANKNNPPAVKAVKPVFPPSAIPEVDSTKVVIVEVPNIAPAVVPNASVKSTFLTCGSFPSLSSKSAFVAQPMTVPIVSNKSTNKNAIKIEKNSTDKIPLKSICKNVGDNDAGIESIPEGNMLKNPFSGFGT